MLKVFATICFCLGFLLTAFGQLQLSPIFSSHMVLQRDQKLNIWGVAGPHEQVNVQLHQEVQLAKADSEGRWEVVLPVLPAGGPYVLKVLGEVDSLLLKDVYLGDVWLCGGQSNMAWTVERFPWARYEVQSANFKRIRLLNIKESLAAFPSSACSTNGWREAQDSAILDFSAVGYFFGKYLHQEVDVAIGLISSAWSGTNIESWIPESHLTSYDEYLNYRNETIQTLPVDSLGPNDFSSVLYNGMIHPIRKLPIKGVIWYQGENNAHRAAEYEYLFPQLIRSWRAVWNQPQMPFLYVQLANFLKPDSIPKNDPWPFLRDAQDKALSLPATAMATAIDIGEVDNIHPANKQEVGRRLSLLARKLVYGQEVLAAGPRLESYEIIGNSVRLRFIQIGDGLRTSSNGADVMGFDIAGPNQRFYRAHAKITAAGEVEVWSPEVPNPIAVRYAWANNPAHANLVNSTGLPAYPFRTDQWENSTAGVSYFDVPLPTGKN